MTPLSVRRMYSPLRELGNKEQGRLRGVAKCRVANDQDFVTYVQKFVFMVV